MIEWHPSGHDMGLHKNCQVEESISLSGRLAEVQLWMGIFVFPGLEFVDFCISLLWSREIDVISYSRLSLLFLSKVLIKGFLGLLFFFHKIFMVGLL